MKQLVLKQECIKYLYQYIDSGHLSVVDITGSGLVPNDCGDKFVLPKADYSRLS